MKKSTKTEHEARENQSLASRKQRVHREDKQGESLDEGVGKNPDSLAAGLTQPARLEQRPSHKVIRLPTLTNLRFTLLAEGMKTKQRNKKAQGSYKFWEKQKYA